VADKPRIGDVIEIPTRKGLAYAQYSHHNEEIGALVRVLPQFHSSRPTDFRELVNEKEQYVTFFPVHAAVRQGIFKLAGHAEVPAHAQRFPTFRSVGGIDRKTGKPLNWWLWDGKKEWFVGESLTDEQKRLPPKIVMTDVSLVRRLVRGWTPEMDFAAQPQPEPPDDKPDAGSGKNEELRHFLYFSSEANARAAASELGSESVEVSITPGGDESEWVLLVSQVRAGDGSEGRAAAHSPRADRLQAPRGLRRLGHACRGLIGVGPWIRALARVMVLPAAADS